MDVSLFPPSSNIEDRRPAPSGAGNWINNQPPLAGQFTGGSFGRLVPFDPNAVYPPITGGKIPDRVLPPPEGFGQTPDTGGGSSQGDNKPAEEEPDKRENERHNKRAKSDPDKSLYKPQKAPARVKSRNKGHASKHLGINSLDQEGGNNTAKNSDPASIPDAQAPCLGGLARDISTAIPAMEQILQSIPDQLLGTFLSQLPGPLQSLIPQGLIPGLGGAGGVNLNNLLAIASIGASGGVPNMILGQLLGSVGVPPTVIQNLTPAVIQQLGAGLGEAASFSALAQTISGIQLASGVVSRNNIPIDPQILNLMMGQVLSANSLGGVASNLAGIANNPIGTILNAAMGGNSGQGMPLIPSNLSSPPTALLNGLGNQVPQQLLGNLLNPSQILGMLPPQLQAMIPAVATAGNIINQLASSAPEKVPGSDVGNGTGNSKKPKKKEALNDGKSEKGQHDIDYSIPLSPNFDLFQLTQGTGVEPGNGKLYKKDTEVDEVIKNLSELAVNVLEPIYQAYPTMQILAGFTESGEHAKGKAVDIGFNVSPTKLMEIADWVRQNVPFKELQMNFQKKGWLHIVTGDGGGGGVTSSSPSGVESGLVNRKC